MRGDAMVKFCGSRGRRKRHVRVLGTCGTLAWAADAASTRQASRRREGQLMRADECRRHVAHLDAAERARCFEVTLESRTLTLMAPTAEAKEMWVVGINAILSGLYF
mmetsp:Transcript_29411/g.91990  ORF Transcript_29411/g.91990 Transcript_29411/m.91990 type:complete len:107 (+) Transcript_29411:3-323(+)